MDEYGKFHQSNHKYNIPIWEVLNEVDYEHSMTPEQYTKRYDAIVSSIRRVQPKMQFVGLALAGTSSIITPIRKPHISIKRTSAIRLAPIFLEFKQSFAWNPVGLDFLSFLWLTLKPHRHCQLPSNLPASGWLHCRSSK